MHRDDLFQYGIEALDHYGGTAQIRKCLEECKELESALTDWLTIRETKELDMREAICGFTWWLRQRAKNAVIDEIADVTIMVNQMRLAFGTQEVDNRIAYKIERQRKRMRGWE